MKHLKPAKILAYITIGLVSLALPFTAKSSEIKASYNEYNYYSLKHLIPKKHPKKYDYCYKLQKKVSKKAYAKNPWVHMNGYVVTDHSGYTKYTKNMKPVKSSYYPRFKQLKAHAVSADFSKGNFIMHYKTRDNAIIHGIAFKKKQNIKVKRIKLTPNILLKAFYKDFIDPKGGFKLKKGNETDFLASKKQKHFYQNWKIDTSDTMKDTVADFMDTVRFGDVEINDPSYGYHYIFFKIDKFKKYKNYVKFRMLYGIY